MIVRKLKTGVIQIIDTNSLNEIESFTLLNVSDKDAFRLLSSSKNFKNENEIITISYSDNDDVDKMFKKIANKHKQDDFKKFIDVSKKYFIDKDINIKGTSVLLRDVTNHSIKVAKRSTTNSKEGSVNRLFINNIERDLFFKDAKNSLTYKNLNKFMINASLDEKLYLKWSDYMTKRYLEIISKKEV